MAKPARAARPRLRRRLGRGVLTLLALLLLSSALLRLGGDSGAALAREVADRMGSAGHEPVAETAVAGCAPVPEIAPLLGALQQRESAVTAREAAVSDEMLALDRAREEVAREMAALQGAEAQLEQTLALADGAAESDLAKLTRMYEVMKPKDAAALFEEMDPTFAAGFLGRMQAERAAAVLAGMEPKAAYRLSLILAGRNGAAPTE